MRVHPRLRRGEDSEENAISRRKKPYRYRWPDDIRDEVLALLLKLNAERAEEERRTGEAAAAAERQKTKKRARRGKGTIIAEDGSLYKKSK